MPTPHPDREEQDAWMSRCVPAVLDDGAAEDQDQAVAMCLQMWRDATKAAHKTTIAKAPGKEPLEYIMSDGTVDRVGDVIEPNGWQVSHFQRNPIALFNHDSRFIVGHWKDVRVEDGALRGRLELMDAVSDRLREVHAAVKAGILRAVSVGFRALKSEPLADGGLRFTKAELIEASLVSIPANPNALAIAKSLNLSADARALIFGKSADEDRKLARRSPGVSAARSKSQSGHTPMTPLSQRIEDAQQRLVARRDKLTEHLNEIGDEPDEDQIAITDELNEQIALDEKSVSSLKQAEARLAITSEPANDNRILPAGPGAANDNRRPFAVPAKKVEPSSYMLRVAAVKVLSHIHKESPDLIRQRLYGDDECTKAVVSHFLTKAASAPATTTTSGWASQLVETVNVDFMESLIPASVYPGLSARGLRLTFGRAGVINIPTRSATPTIAGSFVAEGAPIPVRQGAFASVTLTPKKLAVISTFTREIAQHSTPAIEGLIRDAIQEDTAVAIDTILLDATAASTTRPAGLRDGVAVTAATAGGGFAALVGDIKALVNALVTATNGNLRQPVWIMNPVQALSIAMTQNAGGDFPFAQEINGNTLQGYPVILSSTVTAGMVILVDAGDFVSVTGDEPMWDVSDQATLHMEDTTPLAIGTAGAPNTVAAPVRSLWQTDTIGLRMILPMNWALRRTGVVAWTQAVTW